VDEKLPDDQREINDLMK